MTEDEFETLLEHALSDAPRALRRITLANLVMEFRRLKAAAEPVPTSQIYTSATHASLRRINDRLVTLGSAHAEQARRLDALETWKEERERAAAETQAVYDKLFPQDRPENQKIRAEAQERIQEIRERRAEAAAPIDPQAALNERAAEMKKAADAATEAKWVWGEAVDGYRPATEVLRMAQASNKAGRAAAAGGWAPGWYMVRPVHGGNWRTARLGTDGLWMVHDGSLSVLMWVAADQMTVGGRISEIGGILDKDHGLA